MEVRSPLLSSRIMAVESSICGGKGQFQGGECRGGGVKGRLRGGGEERSDVARSAARCHRGTLSDERRDARVQVDSKLE